MPCYYSFCHLLLNFLTLILLRHLEISEEKVVKEELSYIHCIDKYSVLKEL